MANKVDNILRALMIVFFTAIVGLVVYIFQTSASAQSQRIAEVRGELEHKVDKDVYQVQQEYIKKELSEIKTLLKEHAGGR